MKKILATGFSALIAANSIPAIAEESQDKVKNVTFTTKDAVVLMPCMDKTGTSAQVQGAGAMQMSTKNEFCTEILNQLIRDGGAKTVSWFKVNKKLQQVVNSSWLNPFGLGADKKARMDLTSDIYIPELITASKALRAKYIVRPIVLNKDSTTNTSNKGPGAAAMIPYVGMFAGRSKTETTKSSNVTVKFDIISVPEEDIVATRTFSGDVNTSRKQSGYSFEMSNQSFNAGGMDAGTRAAMTDALYKGVEYLADRIN